MNIPSTTDAQQVRRRDFGSLQEEFQLLKESEPEEVFRQNTSVIRFLSEFNLETMDEFKKAWNILYQRSDIDLSQNNKFINCASSLLQLLKSYGCLKHFENLTLGPGSNPDVQFYAKYLLKNKKFPFPSKKFHINFLMISTTVLNLP